MFGTIRRHQTWLWAIIITVTVISFVFFFSPYAKNSGGGGSAEANLGSISGQPISLQDYRQAQAEMFIHYFLSHGEWPDKDASAKQLGFDTERETYFRLFFISKFAEYHIHVSPRAVGEQAASILRSMGRNGSTPTLEEFETKVLQPRGFTIADFQRFLQHQLALRELIAVIGMNGQLVTADEAASLFQLEHEQIATEAVFFSASNHLASVTVTPEALSQFYTNQMARYRLPDRVSVSYVKFNITNFFADADQQLAKLTNYDQIIDAEYLRLGTNLYSEAKTPAEAKTKMKDADRRNRALVVARNQAAAFAEELLGMSPVQPANLDTLAAKKGLVVGLTAPFDLKNGPAELDVTASFAKVAFKLAEDEPIAESPIPAQDGVYIIALKKKLPSEVPSLDSIRAKVQADCQFIQAERITYSIATNFVRTLSTGMAQGKTFSTLCTEAGLAPVKLPAFSLSTRTLPEIENRVSFGRLQEVAFSLPAGQVSGVIQTDDGGGLILHVLARAPGSEDKTKNEFPAFLAQVRQTRQGEAFNAWFGREAERALRDTPIARQKQPQP